MSVVTETFTDSPAVVITLLKWLQTLETDDATTPEEKEWIAIAVQKPSETILFGIAQGHARLWLQNEYNRHKIPWCYHFLQAYIGHTADQSLDPDAAGTVSDRPALADSSAEEIIKVARWANLEETVWWCYRVNLALCTAGHFEQAIEVCEQACEKDPDDPFGPYGLAFSYMDFAISRQTDKDVLALLEKAVPSFQKAASMFDDRNDDLVSRLYCLRQLALVLHVLGRTQDSVHAFETALAGWESMNRYDDWEQNRAVSTYIEVLISSKRYEEAMNVLDRVQKHPRSGHRHLLIVYSHWLSRGTLLLQLTYKTKRFDVFEAFWNSATHPITTRAAAGENSVLKWHRAEAMNRLREDREEEVVFLLKQILSDLHILTPSNEWHWIERAAERELARLYFKNALENRDRDDWQGSGRYADELSQLARSEGGAKIAFKASIGALIFAAWNRVNSRIEQAKVIARPSLDRGIEMLYDSDPENDAWALMPICNSLLVSGSHDDAVATHGLMASIVVYGDQIGLVEFGKVVDEIVINDSQRDVEETTISGSSEDDTHLGAIKSDSQHQNDTKADTGEPAPASVANGGTSITNNPEATPIKDHTDNIAGERIDASPAENDKTLYTCDGICFQRISFRSSWRRCVCCLTDFCASCYTLVKEAKMSGYYICGSSHEFVTIPPVERLPEGSLRVNGDLVPVQMWLDDIADRYGIPRRSPK